MDTLSNDAIRFANHNDEPQTQGPTGSWYIFLFAVIITLFTVYWGFVRPTSRQLTKMRRYVTSLETSIAELNNQRAGTEATIALLEQLIQQGQLTTEAESALADVRAFHHRVVHEASQLTSAEQALTNLAGLRTEVARQSSLIDATHQALSSVEELNAEVVRISGETDEAKAAVESMAVVRDGLIESIQQLDEVRPLIAGIDAVHSRMNAARDRAESAQQALDELIHIGDQIEAQAASVEKASTTLDAMVGLQEKVIANTAPIATAIETLEAATDVQIELQRASETFYGVKQVLTEMSLLQPRLDQAAQCLKPLTQLTDLRRLGVGDLQRVAEVVRQRYLTVASQVQAPAIVADASEIPNVE